MWCSGFDVIAGTMDLNGYVCCLMLGLFTWQGVCCAVVLLYWFVVGVPFDVGVGVDITARLLSV